MTNTCNEKDGLFLRFNVARIVLAEEEEEEEEAARIVVSLLDVTERQRAEEALQESEQRLKEAQAMGRIGNWEFDIDSQTINWSDQVFKLYERDPALGPPTAEEEATYYTPEQAKILREYAQRAIETGEEFKYDLEAKLPSGRPAHFSAFMRPIKDKSGRVVRLFGTVQDITERQRAEEEIRERNRELAALNAITAAMMQSALHLDEVLQLTADGVVQGLGCNTGFIFLLDEKEGVFRGAAASTRTQILQRLNAIIGFPLLQIKIPARSDLNETMSNLLDGRATITHDFYELVRPFWSRRVCSAMQRLLDSKTFFALPLLAKGKTVGGIVASMPEELSEGDTEKLMTFANQAAIAIENARLFEEVQAGQERLRLLAQQVISAQEEERKRISQELHDELGQALTAIAFNLAAIRKELPPELDPAIQEKMAEIDSLAYELDGRVSDIALELRPYMLDELGLVSALHWYVRRYARRVDIEVKLEVTDLDERLPSQVETALYRVVQEALTNVARHAQASRVRVRVERKESAVIAFIADDGQGFEVEKIAGPYPSGRGAGLLGIRERVASLGGTFSIQSRPGEGTRLTIEIPM